MYIIQDKDSYDLLSSKVLEIVKLMRESKRFITLEGWRDEVLLISYYLKL